MRKILFFSLLVLPLCVKSQKSGIVNYIISFGQIKLKDTATLYFNGMKSLFITNIGLNNSFVYSISDSMNLQRNGKLINTIPSPSHVFTDFDKKELITENDLVITCYTIEKPKQIVWNITPESKKISGYKCQKATGRFRGRDYIAWFTRDIPSECGPWKFNGLPGLILEVVEKNSHVHILFQSFSTPYTLGIPRIESNNYLSIPQYLEKFKLEVLKSMPDHPLLHIPSVKATIEIPLFTELE